VFLHILYGCVSLIQVITLLATSHTPAAGQFVVKDNQKYHFNHANISSSDSFQNNVLSGFNAPRQFLLIYLVLRVVINITAAHSFYQLRLDEKPVGAQPTPLSRPHA